MADLQELLNAIDPGCLSYTEWTTVGMVIKHEGGTAADFAAWSARDPGRYHSGECEKKWASFNGATTPVTMGTLVQLAKEQGWMPQVTGLKKRPTIVYDDYNFVLPAPDKDYAIAHRGLTTEGPMVVAEPERWNPVQQITDYLTALYDAEDYVGYVLQSSRGDDKFVPRGKGTYTRTQGEIVEALAKCKGDLTNALLGEYDPQAGAWVRLNPLDGKDINDGNVVAYRHCLVEADDWSIEDQARLYSELELPVAALVHSGGKSLHAIVKIEARSKPEYDERVDFLFTVLEKNGLEKQARRNRNLNRLSRLPGIQRGENRQYLVGTHLGKASWGEWKEWIETINDNLPDIECFADLVKNPPPLAQELITGILRKGHKMLVAGPSKAGKSFLLKQLALAIAAGGKWMGWDIAQGRVLYVNLELDRASAIDRGIRIFGDLKLPPDTYSFLDIWNLRGYAAPLDVLAPKLIRRAQKTDYTAVIIDPIYKVLTGSENEADDMAKFCNQFDRICHELGAATIYCHHHSKGPQGQKASRDRSSGSGVFARDPDAILDLIELNISEGLRATLTNTETCTAAIQWLDVHMPHWKPLVEDHWKIKSIADGVMTVLSPQQQVEFRGVLNQARETAHFTSAWRIEATLREFRTPDPIHLFFQAPLHKIDLEGLLKEAKADGEDDGPWKTKAANKKASQETDLDTFKTALNSLTKLANKPTATINDIQKSTKLSTAKIKQIIRHNDFCVQIADGNIAWREDVARQCKQAQEQGISYAQFAESIGLDTPYAKKRLSAWVKQFTENNHD